MDETIKYLQETGLTAEDIHNIIQENAALKEAIITAHYYNNEKVVACGWSDEKDSRYFKRYLTPEEEKDYIELMQNRKDQYIERLKKYWKRYGQHVTTHGYWANR